LFALGAWLLQQQSALPSLGVLFLLLPLLAGWRHWSRARSDSLRVLGRLSLLLACVCAGFGWAVVQASWRLADELPLHWEGRDLRIAGTVRGMPERTQAGWRIVVQVRHALTPGAHVPARIQVSLADDSFEPVPGTLPPVEAGERIVFTARLKRPHGTWNPHGFDFEAWLLERGIRATGYVRTGEPFLREGLAPADPLAAVDRWRAVVRSRLLDAVPDSGFGGVLVALAIGDQQGIGRDQWDVYTRTGVGHLISISGLHITMLASVASLVAVRLWRRSQRLTRTLPAQDAGAWIGLATGVGYALVAGFAIPAQRTAWMLATVVVAARLRIHLNRWDILGLALLVVVLVDSMAVLAPGFWLSFGAVALLMFGGEENAGPRRWWKQWLHAQWAMFLGLAPLAVGLFQQVSIVAPLANAVAIPVVSFAVVPLSLLAAISPWPWPAELAVGILSLLHRALEMLSSLPWASHVQHAPAPWALLMAASGAVWLLLPRGFPSRWLGLLALLPLVALRPAPLPEGEASVTLLDVGQGLAVVVRTRQHTLLFDTGPAWSAEADSASRIVLPYLRGEGVERLDALVVSHDDRDHTGGLGTVLRGQRVGWLLTSLPPSHPGLRGGPGATPCVAGQRWRWDGVGFRMLHPLAGAAGRVRRDNARSCVLRVDAGAASVLITADIERDGEAALLATGAPLAASILVVPHHGSATSSTDAFLDAVRPTWGWIPVGYRNRFGHPHADVVSRYRHRAVRLLRTDASGAVSARLAPDGVRVESWRAQRQRYWHDPPPSF
jgi:competence protein ComEC